MHSPPTLLLLLLALLVSSGEGFLRGEKDSSNTTLTSKTTGSEEEEESNKNNNNKLFNRNARPWRHNNNSTSLCDHLRPEEMPEECTCSEPGHYSLIVSCQKKFNSSLWNDTIGMQINIDPCNPNGSRMTLDVTEAEHHIDYTIAGVTAGEEKNFPIPGLSIAVPTLGHLGVDATVLIVGNPDQLTMKVGLNACAIVRDHDMCASSVPGLNRILPWWVLKGTYSFGDVCNNTTPSAPIISSPLVVGSGGGGISAAAAAAAADNVVDVDDVSAAASKEDSSPDAIIVEAIA